MELASVRADELTADGEPSADLSQLTQFRREFAIRRPVELKARGGVIERVRHQRKDGPPVPWGAGRGTGLDDRIAVGVSGSPKPPPERISLTYPALNRTREVWFVVAGAEKAEAVARSIQGADRHEAPATGAHGQERTIWFVDDAAASRL